MLMIYDDLLETRRSACDADDAIEAQYDQELQVAAAAERRRLYWTFVDTEGWYHVEGTYYANLDDAERVRLLTVDRIVRDCARLADWARSHPEAAC